MGSVGGDDVGAVVVDLGAWLTRVGFAGDDTPRSVFPSAVGYRRDVGGGNGVKTEAVLERGHDAGGAEDAMEDGRDSGEKVGPSSAREGRREAQLRGTAYAGDLLMANPSIYDDVESVYEFLDDGSCKLNHWDAFEDVLRHGVQSQLRSDPGCQPLLVVEPAFRWDPETRTKAAERIFEGLGSSSCFLARGAVMTTFASARSTALVIDVGAQGTACVPVVEGYVLEKASQFSHVGGHLLTSKFRELILAKLKGSPDLLATHEVRRRRENGVLQVDPLPKPEVRTVSHQGFHRMRLFDEMKASMCYLPVLADSEAEKNPPTSTDPSEGSLTPATRKTTAVNHGPAVYELPDGRNLEISPDEATSVPELLFNPPAGGKLEHSFVPGSLIVAR
mmetsp:Transcript_16347/g.33285  ORF Transcript_16347/g.33285 Transcript_16347/m.33285 type:complete len:390 (-) Transcript_16347:1147-2316(-)